MIRIAAARKLAEQLLHSSIVRMPVTDPILDMAARMIMNAVAMDEQRQESERPHGENQAGPNRRG